MGVYPTGDERWNGRQVIVAGTERRWNEGLQAWRNAAAGRSSGPEPLREGFRNSVLDALIVTDSIPLGDKREKAPKIRQLTLSAMLAESMRRISNEESLSAMFR